MTHEEKAAIRADRATMSAIEVARKWQITRQRVYQIVHEPDGAGVERKRYPKGPPEASPVRFPWSRRKDFESLELQASIIADPRPAHALAAEHGVPDYAIYKIRRAIGARCPGRPARTT